MILRKGGEGNGEEIDSCIIGTWRGVSKLTWGGESGKVSPGGNDPRAVCGRTGRTCPRETVAAEGDSGPERGTTAGGRSQETSWHPRSAISSLAL